MLGALALALARCCPAHQVSARRRRPRPTPFLAAAELGAPTAAVMYRVMRAVNRRIEDTRREREARMNFQITRTVDGTPIDTPATMRTMPAPGPGDVQQ